MTIYLPDPLRRQKMSNIIKFPPKSVRDWASIERGLIDIIIEAGASQTVKERILKRMKFAFDSMQTEFTFNIPLSESTLNKNLSNDIESQLIEQIRKYTAQIFIDRLKLEIELCQAMGMINDQTK